jgi:Zn-dependent M28 family amino/carboxypeptidase
VLELQGGTPERTVRVVEAVKRGTVHPDEWIAFIAHYDIVPQTVQGAYDDGSGMNMLPYFGKALSRIETKRSIALLWFDAEEQGLVASGVYVEWLRKRHQKVFAGLRFDMVGIGYPARYCICVYHGPNPGDARIASSSEYHVRHRPTEYSLDVEYGRSLVGGRPSQQRDAGLCGMPRLPRRAAALSPH